MLEEFVRQIGGPKAVERYRASEGWGNNHDGELGARVGGPRGWYGLSRQERRERRVSRPGFWGIPVSNALDTATVMLPRLFRDRMDDLGIDFSILYPTAAARFLRFPYEEDRRIGCRAFNAMAAEMYGPYAARMTVAALIPMHTPQEALEELEYAVRTLGHKAVVLATCVRRPIPEVARKAPEYAPYATWMDVLAISSEYDYDPVWQKCVELGVAVTTHTHLMGWGARTSPENLVYNHIGHFAAAGEAFCKAVVMGGVVQRFPQLTFAFLEGGVGWACNLYNDLIEHWEKRNLHAMRQNLDPATLDRKMMAELFTRYGDTVAGKSVDALVTNSDREDPDDIDEFSALEIDDAQSFAGFFENFFFGCEADDRMTAVAFNPRLNHYGTKLQAIFSSDVGHFDVPDITTVVAEAYELVEDGLITEDDFRNFTFANAVKLHTRMNPEFFKGTAVEGGSYAEAALSTRSRMSPPSLVRYDA